MIDNQTVFKLDVTLNHDQSGAAAGNNSLSRQLFASLYSTYGITKKGGRGSSPPKQVADLEAAEIIRNG